MSSVESTVSSPPSCAPSGASVGASNSGGIPASASPLELESESLSSPQACSANTDAKSATTATSHRSLLFIVCPFVGFMDSGSTASGAGIERVLQRVPDQVEGEHGEQECHPGEEHRPPRHVEVGRR